MLTVRQFTAFIISDTLSPKLIQLVTSVNNGLALVTVTSCTDWWKVNYCPCEKNMVETHPTTTGFFLLQWPPISCKPAATASGPQSLNRFRKAAATRSLLCHLCQSNYSWIQSLCCAFLPNDFLWTDCWVLSFLSPPTLILAGSRHFKSQTGSGPAYSQSFIKSTVFLAFHLSRSLIQAIVKLRSQKGDESYQGCSSLSVPLAWGADIKRTAVYSTTEPPCLFFAYTDKKYYALVWVTQQLFTAFQVRGKNQATDATGGGESLGQMENMHLIQDANTNLIALLFRSGRWAFSTMLPWCLELTEFTVILQDSKIKLWKSIVAERKRISMLNWTRRKGKTAFPGAMLLTYKFQWLKH